MTKPTEAAARVTAIVLKLLIETWAHQAFHQRHKRTEANMLAVAKALPRGVDVDAIAKALAELIRPGGNAPPADVLTVSVYRITPFLHRPSRDALISALTVAAQDESSG